MFVQEVRRFFPFFPAVAGRVRETFEWRGYRFDRGTHVMLDLHGTNHDSRVWREPDAFRPERFLQWDGSPSNLFLRVVATTTVTIAVLAKGLRSP